MAAFADDSGLEVEALDGAPGIYSARYATDAQRIAKLLDAMKGKTNRKARFVCVIAIAYRGDDVALFRGEVHGTIAEAPRGSNGFGYDPVFIPGGYDKTFGELPSDVKEAISHRANAIAKATILYRFPRFNAFSSFIRLLSESATRLFAQPLYQNQYTGEPPHRHLQHLPDRVI